MGSIWVYRYRENTITVKNKKATELYVNDELRDAVKGLHLKADLTCTLDTGETVKASLRGTIDVECTLSIDNLIQEPVEIL